MKKSIGLSLVAATLLAGSAMAEEGKLSGDIRGFYLSVDKGEYGTKGDSGASALSAGFNALYESPKMMDGKLSYGLGFALQSNIMETGVEVEQSFTEAQALDESAVVPNQMYVAYDSAIGTIKAGRQILDTPGANADDYRLMPNTFEGVVLINNSIENLTLIGAQVATISGWDNLGSNGYRGYNSMTEAALNGYEVNASTSVDSVEANGATVLAAAYGNGPISAQFWTYNILNTTTLGTNDGLTFQTTPIQLNYFDIGYGLDLGGVKVDLAAQYKSFSGDVETVKTNTDGVVEADQTAIELGHTVTGFKADIALDFGLSILVAMNNVDGDHGVINAWGGYNEYAIADEYWMNSFANAVFSATKVGAMYEMEDMGVGAYMTSYTGDDKEGDMETATITDVYVNYADFALVYETQAQTASNPTSDPTITDPDDVTLIKLQYTKAF